MSDRNSSSRNPWTWIPTLYLAQGLPFAVVNSVSIIMYKSLGVSNADIAFYTAWLYLPWVIKPLWSPVVDILRTRRWWIWIAQLVIGAGFAVVGLTLPLSLFFQASLAVFYLIAFSSATHDIAADGYYLLALNEKEQSFFVGIRSTFFRISMVFGQGLLVIVAGLIQSHSGLAAVPLRIEARPGVALVTTVDTNVLTLGTASTGSLRLMAEPTVIELAPQPRPKAEVSALVSAAKAWNQAHGFTTAEAKTEKKAADQSWFDRKLTQPLGDYLKAHFGRDASAKVNVGGNVGIARLRLSQPPGREIVTTLSLNVGSDKSIAVAEGARLVFNDSNWNQPALVAVQLDPKLTTPSTATYSVLSGNVTLAWTTTFFVLLGLFLAFGFWHRFILPRPAKDRTGEAANVPHFIAEFFSTFGAYFAKPRIGVLLLFLLIYRFGEAQLVKMVTPFLLDAREVGGLGLTTGQVGFVYGTVGILALTVGGVLGGFVASRFGLKSWLWPMVLIIHLPDAIFIYLAHAQPDSLWTISACVAVEQFGYGFGFTAYMLYMIYIARGQHQTAHYAICTGFMALGMMIPGMWSGWLQETIGYSHFFTWVILATIPSFLVVLLIPLDSEFGRKRA